MEVPTMATKVIEQVTEKVVGTSFQEHKVVEHTTTDIY